MRLLFPCREEPRLKEMHCLLYLGEESLLVGCQTSMVTSVDLTRACVTSEVGVGGGSLCDLRGGRGGRELVPL